MYVVVSGGVLDLVKLPEAVEYLFGAVGASEEKVLVRAVLRNEILAESH